MTLISEGFLRGMFWSGRSSSGFGRRYGGRSAGGGQAAVVVLALIFAVLAPILARLFYFAISRKREFLADAEAARLTRFPQGLASALEKISGSTDLLNGANSITAPMFITNPFAGRALGVAGLMDTHPPIQERVRILRAMAGNAGYQGYQAAYQAVKGAKETLIPPSGLAQKETIPFRAQTPAGLEPMGSKDLLRQIGDLSRAAQGFIFLPCACGLRIKLPPEFKGDHVQCPRCARTLTVPTAELAAAGVVLDSVAAMPSAAKTAVEPPQKQTYVRRTNQWESVRCQCGHVMQVSPLFAGTRMRCRKCGQAIEIVSQR